MRRTSPRNSERGRTYEEADSGLAWDLENMNSHDAPSVKALNTCDVIVGYTVYVDLAKPYFPNKEFLTTPMKREIERCEMAFAEAEKGRSVVMICSGDAGIYGMAGPILELGEKHPRWRSR